MDARRAVVFVHGNPETDAVWSPLIAELGRGDVVCLSPPGFGAPFPPGFGCTVREYRDWLIGQLERFDGPVDLVGHDWGGGHVVNVAMARPDLLHSWATDAIGVFDPAYAWHNLAQGWQTPGTGEESVGRLLGGTTEQRAAYLVGRGIAEPVASRLADGQDEAMGRAILALYRSAAQPVMADLGRELPAAARRPGLCLARHGGRQRGLRGDAPSRRRARVPVWPCSTGWVTGGWCKIRHAGRGRSGSSGRPWAMRRATDRRAAAGRDESNER